MFPEPVVSVGTGSLWGVGVVTWAMADYGTGSLQNILETYVARAASGTIVAHAAISPWDIFPVHSS